MTLLERMATRIRKLREARGMTQAALAARAGLSREYLARLETARQDPRLSVVVKLARALRVKASALID
jgi:transcriptional regulator with XRE-family HTH domain